jgi:hypothetical protein
MQTFTIDQLMPPARVRAINDHRKLLAAYFDELLRAGLEKDLVDIGWQPGLILFTCWPSILRQQGVRFTATLPLKTLQREATAMECSQVLERHKVGARVEVGIRTRASVAFFPPPPTPTIVLLADLADTLREKAVSLSHVLGQEAAAELDYQRSEAIILEDIRAGKRRYTVAGQLIERSVA